MKFQPLETKRLMLNEFKLSDVDDLTRICSNDDLAKYLLKLPVPYTKQDAINRVVQCQELWKKGEILVWAVRRKDDTEGKVVASVEIRKDHGMDNIGVWVDPEVQGHGFASEAIDEVVRWSLENKFTKDNEVYYALRVGNEPSQRLAKRLGFKYAKTLNTKQYDVRDRTGEFFDFEAYVYRGKHLTF